MASGVILKKNIISEWGRIVTGAQDKADEYQSAVIAKLEEYAVPGITWEYEDFGAKKKLFGGAKGETRRYLVVSSTDFNLIRHRIGAQPYGNCLSITRYFCSEHMDLASRIMSDENMSIFESEKLILFNTIVHEATVEAVRDLMEGLGQDFSKVDTKSKGFLDAW